MGWLCLAWMAFIVYATNLPFHLDAKNLDESWRLFEQKPFFSSRMDMAANILAFVPGGLLLFVVCVRRVPPWMAWFGAATIASLLSIAVEILQLWQTDRATSLMDLLSNGFGAVCGASVAWRLGFGGRRDPWRHMRRHVEARPMTSLLAVVLLVLFVLSLAPFKLSLDVGMLWAEAKQGHWNPFASPWDRYVPLRSLVSTAADVVGWMFLSALFLRAYREHRPRGEAALWWTALFCLAVSLSCELLRLMVVGSPSDLRHLQAAGAGAVILAIAAPFFARTDSHRRATLACLTWIFVLAADRWAPFELRDAPELSWSALVPFAPYYHRTDPTAVADLLWEASSFAVLGFALAWRLRAPRTVLITLLVGSLAAGFELGQSMIVGRTPDLSDVLFAMVGGWLGARLYERMPLEVNRARFAPGGR